MSGSLAFRVQPLGTCLIARLSGEIDLANGHQLYQALLAEIEQGRPYVVVDLEDVTFLGTAGLTSLVAAHHRARAVGGGVWLARAQPIVRRVLEITQLDVLLGLCNEIDDALEHAMSTAGQWQGGTGEPFRLPVAGDTAKSWPNRVGAEEDVGKARGDLGGGRDGAGRDAPDEEDQTSR